MYKVLILGNQDNLGMDILNILLKNNIHSKLLAPKYLYPVDDKRSNLNKYYNYKNVEKNIIFFGATKHKYYWFRNKELKKITDTFDHTISVGMHGLMLCCNLNKPNIHISIGAELVIAYKGLRENLNIREIYKSLLLIFSYQKSNFITDSYPPYIKIFTELNLSQKCIPLIISNYEIENRNTVTFDKLNYIDKYEKVFFWAARVNYDKNNIFENKGADILIKLLNSKIYDNQKILFLILNHGNDLDIFKENIKNSKNNIKFIDHLNKSELHYLFSKTNLVVLDSLVKNHGQIYGITREALSLGSILIKSVDEDFYKIIFQSSPPGLFNAYDVKSLNDIILKIINMPINNYIKIIRENKKWVKNNFSSPNISIRNFIYLLKIEIYRSRYSIKSYKLFNHRKIVAIALLVKIINFTNDFKILRLLRFSNFIKIFFLLIIKNIDKDYGHLVK